MPKRGSNPTIPVANDRTVEQVLNGLEALVRLVMERMIRAGVVVPQPQPQPSPDAPILITVAEAAKLLSIKRGQAYDLAARGVIPTVKLGPRSTRVIRQDLEKRVQELLNATGRDPAPGRRPTSKKAGRPS